MSGHPTLTDWNSKVRFSCFIYDIILIICTPARGFSDAILYFSKCEGCLTYNIIIGGWSNTKSVIRNDKDEHHELTEVYNTLFYNTIPSHYFIWFQTKDILSTDVFRRFWVEVIEDGTEFRMEVGRDEETSAFLSRTWMVGSEPLPWADVRYVGFTSYRPGNDWSFTEIKFINPSNMLLSQTSSLAYSMLIVQVSSPGLTDTELRCISTSRLSVETI